MLSSSNQAFNSSLKCQVERLTKELGPINSCIDKLQQELTKLQTELGANSRYYQQQLTTMKKALEVKEFTYETLKKLPHKMFYMTGLSVTEFDCLFERVQPFIGSMIYPDCKESESTSPLGKLGKNISNVLSIDVQTFRDPTSRDNGMDDGYQFINNVNDICWLVCVNCRISLRL